MSTRYPILKVKPTAVLQPLHLLLGTLVLLLRISEQLKRPIARNPSESPRQQSYYCVFLAKYPYYVKELGIARPWDEMGIRYDEAMPWKTTDSRGHQLKAG